MGNRTSLALIQAQKRVTRAHLFHELIIELGPGKLAEPLIHGFVPCASASAVVAEAQWYCFAVAEALEKQK